MFRKSSRYDASESQVGAALVIAVGAAMILGFGALLSDAVLDLAAFPGSPTPMRVAEAVLLTDPPRGSWVRLTDARVDCEHPPTRVSNTAYALVTDASRSGRILVAGRGVAPTCEAWADVELTGTLAGIRPGRVVGLRWPGLPWNAWPTPRLIRLTTSGGPGDSALLVGMMLPLVLLGLVLCWGGALSIRASRRRHPRRSGPLPSARWAMPLSTGASALQLMSVPAGLLQIVAFGPLFIARHLPGWMSVPIGVAWAAWIFLVVGSLILWWKRRASDVLLGPDGLAVRGGPLHGTHVAWADIDPEGCRVERDSEGAGETALILEDEVVARSGHAGEVRSFDALKNTVQALHRQASGELLPAAPEVPPEVVRCANCGAPVAPERAEGVTCSHCGAAVHMPAQVQKQLDALAGTDSARRDTELLLKRLLRQPSARWTTLLAALAMPPLLLGWPAAAITFDELFQTRRLLEEPDAISLFVFAMSFTYGLGWLLRAQVSGREALRLVALEGAAAPPQRLGGPERCRRCGAPLPKSGAEQLVSACLYCRTENVLGLNLVPTAAREEGQTVALRALLRERLGHRRRYRVLAAASLLLLALSAAALAPTAALVFGT